MTILAPIADRLSRLDAVIDLARTEAAHGDEHRALAPEVVAAAKRDGVFCLALPESFGGLGHPPAEVIDVLERMAHADGAAGWCGFIGNATAFFGWLDPTVARSCLQDAPSVAAASIFGPMGQAVPDGRGSYRVDGRWGFASGCLHSEWVQVGVMVMDGDSPGHRADGGPDWRFAYLPAADVEVVDTWDTLGLRGTGSNDVVVRGVTVAPELLAMPLFDPPRAEDAIFQLGFWGLLPVLMGPFALGVARRSLDELEAALVGEVPRPGRAPVREDPEVHHELSRSRAALLGARAFLDTAAGHAWDLATSDHPVTQEHHDRLNLAMQHGMTAALDAVDVAYRFGPSATVRRSDTIQRCFRDLHTARKHIALGPEGYRGPGRRAVGLA
jgi:alkylation response protein AidB-like acyl-CoA dehydrogenase